MKCLKGLLSKTALHGVHAFMQYLVKSYFITMLRILLICVHIFFVFMQWKMAGGIATRHGLNGPGIESAAAGQPS